MYPSLRRVSVLLVVAVAGLVAGVALASCGGDDEASTTTITTGAATTITTTETTTQLPPFVLRLRMDVNVKGGVPEGGIVRAGVKKGDRVRINVTSDVADEIHVHGYDLTADVAAGGTARIDLHATIPGRFEVELEERGVPIAELTVQP